MSTDITPGTRRDHERPKDSGNRRGTLRAAYTDMDDVDFAAGTGLLRAAGFTVDYLDTQDPDRITAEAHDVTALLVGYATITADMMDKMPQLRIIALLSMGYNTIDLQAARDRGIWVTNIPGAATEEVATHALALTLALTRGLPFYAGAVHDGNWNVRDALVPPRLSHATLGILGLGRIGTRLGELAAPLFGEIIGYDPALPDTPETAARLHAAGIRRTTLADVRNRAAVLSLHMPLTEDTERMIDADFLAAMPAGSFLVNVSRGALVDSAAVRNAVDAGQLSGVGLDVLDEEPPARTHPLLGSPRILVTPHVAYLSDFTEAEYVRQQAQNVATWAQTGRPDTPVLELPADAGALHPSRQLPEVNDLA